MEIINLADVLTIVIPICIGLAIFVGSIIRYFAQKRTALHPADENSIFAGLLIGILIGIISFFFVGLILENIKIAKYNEMVAVQYNIKPNITSVKQVGNNGVPKEITKVKNNNSDEYKDVYIVREDNNISIYTRNDEGRYTKCDKIF